MDQFFVTHTFFKGCLGCVYLPAIMNRTEINMTEKISEKLDMDPLGHIPRNEKSLTLES